MSFYFIFIIFWIDLYSIDILFNYLYCDFNSLLFSVLHVKFVWVYDELSFSFSFPKGAVKARFLLLSPVTTFDEKVLINTENQKQARENSRDWAEGPLFIQNL